MGRGLALRPAWGVPTHSVTGLLLPSQGTQKSANATKSMRMVSLADAG